MTRKTPEIIEVNSQQLEELLDRAASKTLRAEDTVLMRQIFDSYTQFFQIVGDKNTSLARLRKLLFGSSSEKTDAVVASTSPEDASAAPDVSEEPAAAEDESPRRGHGRNGADAYRSAEQIDVPHAFLQAGDACPDCERGKVYEVSTPGVLVRIVGQAPLQARVYHLQKLHCNLCGKVFTAEPPPDAGCKKYDATAASMIALLKYGSGLPFNRL